MTNLKQKLVCGAAALVASATFIGTSSGQAQPVRAQTISVADLNLENNAGRATLAARVRSAASRVCRADDQSVRGFASEKRCIENAVETAMSQAVTRS